MTGEESRPALPATTEIGRVALRVNDLADCLAFYRDVIGLAVLSRDDGRATLGAGGEPLLELVGDLDAHERRRAETGLFHTAFLVPSRQALADALDRIERHTSLSGASDHLVSEALYLSDPEGNGIEVYRDRPRSEWPRSDDGIEIEMLPLDLDALRRQAEATDRIPDETTVGHVHLEVSSIAAARQFYVEALGFAVMDTYGEAALFVAADDYHHHVGLNVWNGRTEPSTGRGLDWFEIRVPRGETLAAVRRRLVEEGFDPELTDGTLAATDDDGIEIRLSQP